MLIYVNIGYMKKNKKNKKKIWIKFGTSLKKNKQFIFILIVISITFGYLVDSNMPVTELSNKGLKLLNKYEYPSYLLTDNKCMEPYDVGDGVVTFGPGITYQSVEQGIEAINQQLNTNYTTNNSCIKESDLLVMQKSILQKYEQIIIDIETTYQYKFNHQQFDSLVLLAYNSPNLFKNDNFINVITNPESSYEEYVYAADNYYQQLSGYFTAFGSGWYNRIVDSAQLFYYGDYRYQNQMEER